MKHIKKYEASLERFQFKKYLDFIDDKFKVDNHPYGKVECNEYNESKDGIEINIRIGGGLKGIDPNYLRTIMDYFKGCGSNITTHSDYLYYRVFLTWKFLEKLDMEIEAKRYNL